MHRRETFLGQGWKRPVQLPLLASYRVRGHRTDTAPAEPLQADLDGQVEHDGHRRSALACGDVEQLAPAPRRSRKRNAACSIAKASTLAD